MTGRPEFRAALEADTANVKQLVDPWQIDLNTADAIPGTVNMRDSAPSTMHDNHLHITCVARDIENF